MSRASVWYIIRRTCVESKFEPYSASSATRWCLTLKITLTSAFLGSITSSKVLECFVNFNFLENFHFSGTYPKNWGIMTLNDIDWGFKTFLNHIIRKINGSWSIFADLTRLTSEIFEIGHFLCQFVIITALRQIKEKI